MVADYFLIRRGNLDLSDMFSQSSSGRYYYTKGVNLRGIAAFMIGFLLPLPGFIGSFGTNAVSTAATDLFYLGWVLSFVMGGMSYWVICLLTGRAMIHASKSLAFEEAAPHEIDTGSGHDMLIVDGVEILIGLTSTQQPDQEVVGSRAKSGHVHEMTLSDP